MAQPTRSVRSFDHGPGPGRSDPLVVEPDLATWAWHRATGAAVAVLTAAALGLLIWPPTSLGDPGGAPGAALVAGAVVYTVGPLLAGLERSALRRRPVTWGRLRRFWLLATLGLSILPLATPHGLLVTAVGGPIAVACAWAAVSAGLRLPDGVGRPLAIASPALMVGGGFLAAAEPSLVDAALALALLVVVPVATSLLPHAPPAAPLAVTAAGAPATAGLLLRPEDGALAAALTLPWVALTLGLAFHAARAWLARGAPRAGLAPLTAYGYLAVGGLWLLADRAAYEPAGFGPPFVQLTAVHFTYAGFVATVLAVTARDRRPDHDDRGPEDDAGRGDLAARFAVRATVTAPPLVALGFVAVGALQIVGAVLLTAGTYALAWVTLRHVASRVRRPAGWLLAASSLSVLAPMVLAVQWAVGHNLGTPALSIAAMTATHGLANAVGFSLLGVLGWRLVVRDGPTPTDEGP